MEKLIYEINGKKYLLFSLVIKNKSQALKLEAKIKLFTGILQSFDPEESFWGGKKVSAKVLIPEEHALAFSNDST